MHSKGLKRLCALPRTLFFIIIYFTGLLLLYFFNYLKLHKPKQKYVKQNHSFVIIPYVFPHKKMVLVGTCSYLAHFLFHGDPLHMVINGLRGIKINVFQ